MEASGSRYFGRGKVFLLNGYGIGFESDFTVIRVVQTDLIKDLLDMELSFFI